MVHPTPERRVNGALEVGDDETGNPCLFLFVRAESHELAVLLLQAPGVLFALGGVAEAELAGLDLIERVRETPLKFGRGYPRAAIAEGLRREHLGRIRAAEISLAEIAGDVPRNVEKGGAALLALSL